MSAMLLFVVPQFKGIYGQLGGTLPLPTRSLLFVSDVFKSYWYIFLGGILAARFFFRRWKRTERGREVVDTMKLRVPCSARCSTDRPVEVLEHAGDAAASGVPILQALEIVSETVNNKVIGKAIADVQISVRDGESIAKPLTKYPVFPPMVVQMISVGRRRARSTRCSRRSRSSTSRRSRPRSTP